jgi:GAF domain-containing protein
LVTRAAAEIRGQKELLETIVQQISERFGFYHAGIFLTDINGEFILLEAASSEGGKKMIQHGHKLAIGRQGIVGFAAYQKRPRIAQDVGADAIFFNNPDLPETHSEMALPLLARNRLVGILDIQSEEHNAFSSEDISTLQIMTDQIALAIENARLLNESRSAIDELQIMTTENISGTWRERLGQLRKGYSYSSSGISAISPTEEDTINNDSKIDAHIIKIPVALRGQRIGQLSLIRKSNESPWTETEQEMADKIAIQVALAIENARLLEESQRRALREQNVNDLSSRFSRSLDVDTLLQNAVRELHRIPQVSEVSVYIAPNETIENQNRNTEVK